MSGVETGSLIFGIMLGAIFGAILFWPALIALLFCRRRFFLVLPINCVVFYTDIFSGEMIAVQVVALAGILWPSRAKAPKPVLPSSPVDKPRWIERRCPGCDHWMPRTSDTCPNCKMAVTPFDRACPQCSNGMSPNSTICPSCGFDQSSGRRSRRPAGMSHVQWT